MASQGGEIEAKKIFDYLTQGLDMTLPEIDWNDEMWKLPFDKDSSMFKPIPQITNAELTSGCVNGSGVFDQLMQSVKAHLDVEFKSQRITGAEYAKTYIALMESAMANATQFLLQRDQAYWQAQAAQMQAFIGMVGTATAKADYVKTLSEAKTAAAGYALTIMKLSTEDMAYGTAKYNLDQILPQQWELVKEQTEVQRAQTLGNRKDGSPVAGVLGKQTELYGQQIISYKRDAEVKAARPFIDAWITMKSIDEGLLPPAGFENASIDKVLTKLKTENGFD